MTASTDDEPEWDGLGGQWTLTAPDNDEAWLTSDVMIPLDDAK